MIGCSKPEFMKEMLSLIMIRDKKEEVLPELVEKYPKTVKIVELKWNEEDRPAVLQKAMVELSRLSKLNSENNGKYKMDLFRQHRLCWKLHSTFKVSAPNVVNWLKECIYEKHKDTNIVIFCEHADVIKEIKILFPQVLVISGEVKSEDRPAIEYKLSKGEPQHLGVLTFKTCGVGLNLAGKCTVVIMLQLPESPTLAEQNEDRVWRKGCISPVFVYYVTIKNSYDDVSLNRLKMKKHMVDKIFT